MELGRGQHGQVVPAVGDGGTDERQSVPEAGGGHVGPHEHWAGYRWRHVRQLSKVEINRD